MTVFRTLISVFKNIRYSLLAVFIAGGVFSVSVWLPNIELISVVFKDSSLKDVVLLLMSLYGSIGTNFSIISAFYTVLIAVLFGVNISLLIYYIRRMQTGASSPRRDGYVSVGGLVSGALGIGCAACGTFILTSAFTLFGASAVLAYLPFDGKEFGFLGVALLLYSSYTLTKKINNPLVC